MELSKRDASNNEIDMDIDMESGYSRRLIPAKLFI